MLKLEERMNMELLSWSVSGLIFFAARSTDLFRGVVWRQLKTWDRLGGSREPGNCRVGGDDGRLPGH